MNILVESYRNGLFNKNQWLRNIVSGMTVAVVSIPLAMAFAIASGAKPEQGLYTAIVAGFLVSVFGGSRVQIAGPTGAFIVILADITQQYGMDGLQIATMLAGVILVLLGLARFGKVIKFIPAPVIVGFTAGIAVIIWVGQWPAFFGLPPAAGLHFHEKLIHSLLMLPHLHKATTAMGIAALMIVLLTNKLPGLQRIPAPLMALILATLAQSYFHFEGIATIGSQFGGIPQGLPTFQLPAISLDRIIELMGPAFTIALLGAIESLLSAVVADGMSGSRHHSNQELIGQGLANIATPLFGGFAATGAIARTATNIRNGGNSPLAGMVHALALLLVIVLFAPFAMNIPLAALAAILFVISWNISDARHVIKMLTHAPVGDAMILLVTFLLTMFLDLVIAVNIGVILAMMHFMLRMAKSVTVEQITHPLDHQAISQAIPKDVLIYSIAGPFFFGAVEAFQQALIHTHNEPRVLIIQLDQVPFVDITALNALEDAMIIMKKREVRVILVGANALVDKKITQAGLGVLLGKKNQFNTLSDALLSLT